jgi:thioester reductase-like protein
MQRSTGSTPQSRAAPADEVAKEIEADARRELDFIPSPLPAPASGPPKVVLLTGATGFLGAFVLRDLLQQTEAPRIVCLVRCSTGPEDALRRLQDNLRRFELVVPPQVWSRVETVTGDISTPQLGLDDATYSRLGDEIDTVIHCAASVNFYQSYRQLRSANVESAGQILRFAVHGRTKHLHYMSSTGVFDSDAGRGGTMRETDAPTHCRGSVMGYTETKWVAEQLMLQARARGLPTSIYRAPFILGDARGVVTRENLVVTMLIGSLQGGAWPAEDVTTPTIQVDALSRALVHLANQREAAGRTYHLISSTSATWTLFGHALQECGYPLDLVSYPEWKQRLREFGRAPDNALRPLVHFFTATPRRHDRPVPDIFLTPPRPELDTTATEAALRPAGLVPPPMDAQLMATYLHYFVRQGWLHAPSASPENAKKAQADSRPPTLSPS